MKQFSFVILTALLILCGGAALLRNTAIPESRVAIIDGGAILRDWRTGKRVIHQVSSLAIVNLQEYPPEGIEVATQDPDAITLFRVTSGKPTRLYSEIKSSGTVLIINPAGVLVGPPSEIDLGTVSIKSSLENGKPTPGLLDFSKDLPYWKHDSMTPGTTNQSPIQIQDGLQKRLRLHGNPYSLAIKKGTMIRTASGSTISVKDASVPEVPKDPN